MVEVLKRDMNKNKRAIDSKIGEIQARLEKMTFTTIMNEVFKKETLDVFVNDCGKREIFLHAGPIVRKILNLTLVIGYKAGAVVECKDNCGE